MKKFFLLLVIIGLAFSYPLVAFGRDDDGDDQGDYRLRRAVEELQATVADLQAQVAALTAAMGAVQTQTDSLTNYISKCPHCSLMNTRINENRDAIALNTAAIASNTTAIASNTTAIEFLASFELDRFTDMGDGTIRDNYSNLFWLKDASCSYLHDEIVDSGVSWEVASANVANLSDHFCRLSDSSVAGDWRLPTAAEWLAFVSEEYASSGPALANTTGLGPWQEGDAFTGVREDWYWGSSPSQFDRKAAVNMDNGGVTSADPLRSYYVWPVRNRLP